MTLPEDLFHFIWKYRLFRTTMLFTQSNKPLIIREIGVHNKDAGPDFIAARIRIGDTEWAGNIEIHVRASEWNLHGHQHDKAYNNVILHVVYDDDAMIYREDGTRLETLVLKPLIPSDVLSRYRSMMSSMHWIPCAKQIVHVPQVYKSQWLSRLLIERMEHRVKAIYELLAQQRGSWEDTCYLWAARCFGFKVNALAFEQLARSLPYATLAKYRQNQKAMEALLFGQAGLLGEASATEPYPRDLRKEYHYLRDLHALTPLSVSTWKFLRTRPSNFPTLRIAQFAALLNTRASLFASIVDVPDAEQLKIWLSSLPVNPYWEHHYRFGEPSATHGCQLGTSSVNNLLINLASGILFAYGKYIGKETYIYAAVDLLESLKAESNAVLDRFSALGFQAHHAGESQALLHLKNVYCDKRRCLECEIGLQIIKHTER